MPELDYQVKKLTFQEYTQELSKTKFSIAYMRNCTVVDCLKKFMKCNIDSRKAMLSLPIGKGSIKDDIGYENVSCKKGHFVFTYQDGKVHRYYEGKNEFYSVCINDLKLLLHYNEQTTPGDDYRESVTYKGVYVNY